MKSLLSAFKAFSHKKIERFKHLQVHYYWWSFFFKNHQSQWALQDTISFLVFLFFSLLLLFLNYYMHFFPCLNSFCMLCGITFFLNCIISGMFSMTCSLVALSLIAKWMIKSSFCCLSLLAHRIINAWPYSGPDLQSAPTPWMLDASFPLEAFNCFWLALPAWFVDARLALMCVWWWWWWTLSLEALIFT